MGTDRVAHIVGLSAARIKRLVCLRFWVARRRVDDYKR